MRHTMTLSLLMVASAIAAQTPTQTASTPQSAPASNAHTQQNAPVETIKARTQVVLLDVVATDHAGHPVTDLKRGDFTILEQGKPQQVASFNLVDTAKRTPLPAGQEAATKLPPGVYGNFKNALAEEAQLTVLLLDALNTPWAHQAFARYEMLKYLQKNHPTGHTAIYALNTRLVRLQDFTDDPEALKKAIQNHKGATSPLIEENPDNPTPMDGLPDTMATSLQSFEEEQASFQTDMRVRMTLDALQAIGRQLAGYAGRKKLIWVSGGFPIDLGPGDAAGFRSQRNYADDITATTSLLRESQVSVYTIDAAGLTTQPIFNAQQSGRGRDGRLMTGAQFGAQMSKDSQAEIAAHMAAKKIADDTGGLAFYNRNDLDTAIMKSVADGAEYYAISYSPENKNWDGKFRRIEVKVNRPGVELRYRKGYNAMDPEQTRDESGANIARDISPALNTVLTSSLISFYGSAQPLQAPAATGAAPPAAAIKLADVRFLVEPRDILFQAHSGKKHCSLEFVAAVFEADKLVKTSDKRLNCNLEQKTYDGIMANGMLFRLPVEVTEGKLRMRLLVRDNLTGKIGSLDLPYPPAILQNRPAEAPGAAPPPSGKP